MRDEDVGVRLWLQGAGVCRGVRLVNKSGIYESTSRRIVVTGASGFIGKHVVAALCRSGAKVFAVSRRGHSADAPANVTWLAEDCFGEGVHIAIGEIKADTLLHLAWTVEHGRFWSAPDNLDWACATARLVRSFAEAGGRRIVGTGTCFEYDLKAATAPLSEEDPVQPATLYGIAKNSTRKMLQAFGDTAGIKSAWARPFYLYGPGEDARRLVSSVALQLLNGQSAACSSGRQRRDFMHVQDAGDAIAALALSAVTGPVNIASGEATTVGDIARTLGALSGRPDLVRIGALPERPDDPACVLANVGRLSGKVGFKPHFTLASGLADALAWWKEHAKQMDRL